MMKWIFGLLLLLNVVFFAVMQWGGALMVDANNPPVQAALNAEKIKIVGMSAPSISIPATPAAPAVAMPPPPPVAPPSHATPAAPPVAPISPATPLHVAPPSPVASPSHTVPLSPATPPPPTAPPVQVAATVSPPAKFSCMEWGEFSGADLLRVEQALSAMKLGNKLKMRIVEYTSGYWVYIAPMKRSSHVKNMIKLLKQLEIEDYFVVQEQGAMKNAISLGVFKTEAAAKKYLAKLQAQGLKVAKIDERASKLKFTVFVLNRLESATTSQITALHKSFPESEIKQIPCY